MIFGIEIRVWRLSSCITWYQATAIAPWTASPIVVSMVSWDCSTQSQRSSSVRLAKILAVVSSYGRCRSVGEAYPGRVFTCERFTVITGSAAKGKLTRLLSMGLPSGVSIGQ